MVGKTLRSVLVIALGALCVAGGCAKKQKKIAAEKEISGAPSISASAVSAKAKPDTGKSGDIFDEFYKGDKTTAKPGAAAAKPVIPAAPAVHQTRKKTSGAENAPQPSGEGNYVVQISCVGSKRLAEKVVSELQTQGYQAYSTPVSNPVSSLNGTYYRIRIGGFATISEARSFAETNLTSKGYQYWVDRKAHDSMSGAEFSSGAPAPASAEPAVAPVARHTKKSKIKTDEINLPPPAPVEPAPPAHESATPAPEPLPAVSAPAAAPAPAPAAESTPATPIAPTPPAAAAPAPVKAAPAAVTGSEAAPATDSKALNDSIW
ncbi:MAG: SPOR domain-containing protein [Chitinivibrionales bacterium]|nr:SPOR domain-containing protein [Chitinivibrionales bacterium]